MRAAVLLLLAALGSGCTTRRAVVTASEIRGPGATTATANWLREELYFGRAIPGGGTVSDSAFDAFVKREITPRFPEGFTILDATGYYLMRATGQTIREPTRVLLVYVREDGPSKTQALNDLIAVYKTLFRQESVLRVTTRVRASF